MCYSVSTDVSHRRMARWLISRNMARHLSASLIIRAMVLAKQGPILFTPGNIHSAACKCLVLPNNASYVNLMSDYSAV